MKTCAIIAEYNPLHKGHIYHITKAKQESNCDCLVVILSSFFSQRGLPSLLSRRDKAKLALEYGADLVLELPCIYAAQSADQFAKFAIQSLSSLQIDSLCFGSETNDLSYLENQLQILQSASIDPSKSWNQNIGSSLQPNDILGIQYVYWCKQYNIRPILIQRNENYKSATQTRADFFNSQSQFNDEYFIAEQNWNSYYPYLRLFLQLTPPERLRTFFLVNEGIEYRLRENAKKCTNWNDFLQASISKTYTRARIQRTCLFVLLQVTKEEMKMHDSFFDVRVLGFNSIGQMLLKENKGANIQTRFKDLDDFSQQVELKVQALYQSVMKQKIKDGIYVVD